MAAPTAAWSADHQYVARLQVRGSQWVEQICQGTAGPCADVGVPFDGRHMAYHAWAADGALYVITSDTGNVVRCRPDSTGGWNAASVDGLELAAVSAKLCAPGAPTFTADEMIPPAILAFWGHRCQKVRSAP